MHASKAKKLRIMFRLTQTQRQEMDEMLRGQGFLWSGCGNESELIREALHRMYQEMTLARPNPTLLRMNADGVSDSSYGEGVGKDDVAFCLSSTDSTRDDLAGDQLDAEAREAQEFYDTWNRLKADGWCGQAGYAQYQDVYFLWLQDDQPSDIEGYIRANARMVKPSPSIAATAPPVEVKKHTSKPKPRSRTSDTQKPTSDKPPKENRNGTKRAGKGNPPEPAKPDGVDRGGKKPGGRVAGRSERQAERSKRGPAPVVDNPQRKQRKGTARA